MSRPQSIETQLRIAKRCLRKCNQELDELRKLRHLVSQQMSNALQGRTITEGDRLMLDAQIILEIKTCEVRNGLTYEVTAAHCKVTHKYALTERELMETWLKR